MGGLKNPRKSLCADILASQTRKFKVCSAAGKKLRYTLDFLCDLLCVISLVMFSYVSGEQSIDTTHHIAFVYVHSSDTCYNTCLLMSEYWYVGSWATGLRYNTSMWRVTIIPKLLTSSLVRLTAVLPFFVLLVLSGEITYKVKQMMLASHHYEKSEAYAALVTSPFAGRSRRWYVLVDVFFIREFNIHQCLDCELRTWT